MIYYYIKTLGKATGEVQFPESSSLVVFAGTVCDFRLSYGRVLNRRSKIIAVNRDKSQLLKNSDMFWKPTVAIQGKFKSYRNRPSC